jgi:hypothetical protein
MARPSVVVVCTNVAQAGRLAQGLGTNHGHDGSVSQHDLGGPRTTTTTRNGRAASSIGARSSTAVRVWKVFDGKTLHEVKDLGTHLEARSEDGGGAVWTGVRLPSGGYETRSTTFPTSKLASFLQKVHDGDQTTPGAREAPASTPRAAPASGPRAVKRPAAATARKPAAEARPEAPVATPKKRGRPAKAKPTTSAPPKSKAPASVKPKSKAPASATPKSKAPASAARPKTKQKPKAETKAKRKPAAKIAASGPPTSRSPVSTHVTPASMRRHLHAKDPETPEAALATLEDIWRGGASEPTRAWMIAKGFTDLADAFVDWVEHHTTEANGYMQAARAQRSA